MGDSSLQSLSLLDQNEYIPLYQAGGGCVFTTPTVFNHSDRLLTALHFLTGFTQKIIHKGRCKVYFHCGVDPNIRKLDALEKFDVPTSGLLTFSVEISERYAVIPQLQLSAVPR